MLRQSRIVMLLHILLLGMLAVAAPVLAQEAPPAAINVTFAEVTQGRGDNTALGLYFTVNDASGNAIEPGSARSAVIQLEDGTRTDARIEEANSPLFVVIVLDASGSMGGAATAMRSAAITAVQNLPDGTRFSVMTFNRQISTATEFAQDKNGVINIIGEYRPANPNDPNAGTCLFDATYAALQKAAEIPLPARRAVLLFTDGRDELIAGGAIDPCSTRTLDEVVTRATDIADPITVYAIGLTGGVPIAEAELRRITDASNGAAVFGDLQQLPTLFEQIVNSLRNQRVARADVCITRGAHTATLLINAGGAQSATFADSISFQANLDCIPATPTSAIEPEVNFDNAVFDPGEDTVTFTLSAAGEEQIDRYQIEVVGSDGTTVASFQQNAPLTGPITFSVEGVPDGNIVINVRMIRPDGSTANRTGVNRTVRIPRPTPTPTLTLTNTPSPTITPSPLPRTANIDGIQLDRETDTVIVNLLYGQRQEINRIRISVFDRNNTLVRVVEPPGLDDQVTFAGRPNGLEAGQTYTVRVQSLDAGGTILNQSSEEFTYTPIVTETPTITPSPTVTFTPTPVTMRAAIDNVTFDAEQQQFVLQIAYENIDLIESIEIHILDGNGLLVDKLLPSVVETVTYAPGSKLIGQQQYVFRIKAISFEGRVVDEQERQVTDPRTSTPTPTSTETPTLTPTITPTPTETPVVVNLTINTRFDMADQNLIIEYVNSNPQAVQRYRVQLVARQGSNVLVDEVFIPSQDNTRAVPMQGRPTGDYEVTLIALDGANQTMAEASSPVLWTQPEPTPVPPEPSAFERNPILAVIVFIIVLILVGVLVWMIVSGRRERTKRANTSASLPSQTGAFIIPTAAKDASKPSSPKPSAPAQQPAPEPKPSRGSDTMQRTAAPPPGPTILDQPTVRPTPADSFATNAAMEVGEATGGAATVTGYLIVQESKDTDMVGKVLPLSASPFHIGRTGPRPNHVNFDGDKNLSRAHCELTYDRDRWYLSDTGSQLGTTVNNGERITGRIPLDEGDEIRLGGTTVLTFTRKG